MKIAVVGAGKLGAKITEALLGGDHSVTVIDKDPDLLQKLSQNLDIMTVTGNAKQTDLLSDLNIDTYDYLIAVTDRDEKNIVIASFAKKIGCRKVMARVRDPEHINQIDFIKESMDIDYIVNPDLAIATEIYKYLVEKSSLATGIFTSGKVSLLEFPVSRMPQLIDKPLYESADELAGMLAVAVSRNGKVIIPHGNTVIRGDDALYVIGSREQIMQTSQRVHERMRTTADLQKVMIVGGGKTGFYLAQKLAEFGTAVKIIEIDKVRCHYLAGLLDDVMILNGDATDISLLEEENIEEMDAFVSATGFDEENLLLALIAKRKGIEDVIAKVSHESYAGLIESMGIDMALNPVDITATSVMRYIQGSKRIISSQLIQGQAEIMEIVASGHMKLINKPLRELDLPDSLLISAIHRGNTAIIPNGDTVILPDDRVIIICLLSEIKELEALIKVNEKGGLFRR